MKNINALFLFSFIYFNFIQSNESLYVNITSAMEVKVLNVGPFINYNAEKGCVENKLLNIIAEKLKMPMGLISSNRSNNLQ